MHAKQMQALDVIPEIAAEFASDFGRDSGGLVRRYRTEDAETIVVALGSVLGTIEDVVDELREQGVKIGALGIKCFRPFPLEEVREALAGARAGRRAREGASRSAPAGSSARTSALALSGLPPRVYDVVAGLGGRPITKQSLHGLFAEALARPARAGRLHFLDLDRELVERELERDAGRRPPGPARREHPPRHRRRRRALALRAGAEMPYQEIKLYQAGTFVVGNRLLDPEQRSVQARMERSNTLTSGHRACQGCGEALGARYALDAAMRATRGPADRRQRDRLPRGLLDALSRSRPGSCPGSTRCSATRRRSPPASPRR